MLRSDHRLTTRSNISFDGAWVWCLSRAGLWSGLYLILEHSTIHSRPRRDREKYRKTAMQINPTGDLLSPPPPHHQQVASFSVQVVESRLVLIVISILSSSSTSTYNANNLYFIEMVRVPQSHVQYFEVLQYPIWLLVGKKKFCYSLMTIVYKLLKS